MYSVLLDAYRADGGTYDLPVKAMRTARRSRILGMARDFRTLMAIPAFRHHVASDPVPDPLFFLSHRHYLVRGLTPRQRLTAALTHYRHQQTTFDRDYFDSVYLRGGLRLWTDTVAGVTYDITLQPGNDVMYEGGLSLVLNVDGGRVCVMSFSVVPTDLVLPDYLRDPKQGPFHRVILFLTRKQLASNHSYQRAFNAAFHRCTPGHLCFGALTGMANALRHSHVFGIDPERHPSWQMEYAPQFRVAYADFWQSLSGRKVSEWGYLIDVPMHLTPLDDLGAARRKRATNRRAHIDGVSASAHRIISSHLTSTA